MKKSSKEHIFIYKILFTAMIMCIYIIGRNISVYGVDISAYQNSEIDAQGVFLQSLSGDFKNVSIFILGLFPYMIASILAILYSAIRSIDKNAKMSSNHLNRATLTIMMIIGVIQAFQKVRDYKYLDGYDTLWVKVIVFWELITGMLLIIYLCDRSIKYGIGGRAAIFLVNIYDGIFKMIQGRSWNELKLPLLVGLIEAILMIIFDNTEKRIPVLRVSIHSIYADKNYIAFKLIPVGVMPIMFASAFFALIQMIVRFFAGSYSDNVGLVFAGRNMNMNSPLGMIVYIGVIWFINILFSFIMLRPISMADGLRKSGDSLENIYAGKRTTLYLVGCVLRLSIYSSIIFSIFCGVPFLLHLRGYIDSSLMMLSNSIMMSTGFWIMLYRESEVYINCDKYRPFI